MFDAEQGWEVRFCQNCGFAIEKSQATQSVASCPLCRQRRREVKLVDRFVVHRPVNKVSAPRAGD